MRLSIDLDTAIAVSRRKWVFDVLCAMHGKAGARTIELLHLLGVTRDGLRRTLECAVEDGLVRSNPGHGHPLRPEWILTSAGVALAATAVALRDVENRIGIAHFELGRWGLPTTVAVADGAQHFNDIVRALDDVTPRALSLSLVRLNDLQIVERRLLDGRPPRSEYSVTGRGARLVGLHR